MGLSFQISAWQVMLTLVAGIPAKDELSTDAWQ
jgi:hypothetical protein